MLCNRKEKIIHNYFGRLVELLLGTADYAYARWHIHDPNPKIEYYNSSLNFLTIFLKDEPSFRALKELFGKLGTGVHEIDGSDARVRQVFDLGQSGSYLC